MKTIRVHQDCPDRSKALSEINNLSTPEEAEEGGEATIEEFSEEVN